MRAIHRRRPSPALVVALLALFVALGGTGYAAVSIGSRNIADNSVRSIDLKNNDVRSADVRDRSLRAKDFKPGELPAGQRGPKGDAGPQGPAGATSPQGSPASSMITGGTTIAIPAGGGLHQYGPSGTNSATGGTSLSPNAPGPGGSVTATLNANGAAALSCTIGGNATTCDSGAATATIAPASRLTIFVRFENNAALGTARWGYRTP